MAYGTIASLRVLTRHDTVELAANDQYWEVRRKFLSIKIKTVTDATSLPTIFEPGSIKYVPNPST